MSHVTHLNESWNAPHRNSCEYDSYHTESCVRHLWAMHSEYHSSHTHSCLSHSLMSLILTHVSHTDSCLSYLLILSHLLMCETWHGIPWLIQVKWCSMTHSSDMMFRDSFKWHASLSHVTHSSDMPHFICSTINESCHVNESCLTHECIVSKCEMSHVTHTSHLRTMFDFNCNSSVRVPRLKHLNESCHALEWVMSHTRMTHVTHLNRYGVATISRLLKIIGLVCIRAL